MAAEAQRTLGAPSRSDYRNAGLGPAFANHSHTTPQQPQPPQKAAAEHEHAEPVKHRRPPPPPPAAHSQHHEEEPAVNPFVVAEGRMTPSDETVHEHQAHDETFFGGVHTKRLTHLPFKVSPMSQEQSEREGGAWALENYEGVEWLSLFYDLVVVAVIATFGSAHEISNPGAIPLYVSYFVIVYRCWTAQIYYDVRYQTEDMYHRIMKAIQIAAFVYMGAGSGNWAPNRLQSGESLGLEGDDYVEHRQAKQSFDTVAIAFLIYRALLLVQYTVCAFQAHFAHRHRRGLITEACSFFISGILSLIAIVLPPNTHTLTGLKLGLFYGGLVLEILATNGANLLSWHARVHPSKFASRYAGFSLIILGEGFLNITNAFRAASSGVTHDDTDVYLQVFLVVGVIWCLYLLLFARFNPEDSVSHSRGFGWQMIHLPLHLGLLLLLAAMINVVTNLAFNDGIDDIFYRWGGVAGDLSIGVTANTSTLQQVGLSLGSLPLIPDWETMYNNLEALYLHPDNITDPDILSYQYFGQIVYATVESYNIRPGKNATASLIQLQALNASFLSPNHTANFNESLALFDDLIVQPGSKALSGCLWLFPTAGAVLILCAIRSLLWYRYVGVAHWIIHLPQIVLGIGLGLLGILDRGSTDLYAVNSDGVSTVNKMYDLVFTNWPLAIISIVYCVAWFGPMLVLLGMQRGGRSDVYPVERVKEDRGRIVETNEKRGSGRV